MKSIYILIAAIILSVVIYGCEDPVPTNYKEEYVVEALLFVGEPIEDIKVLRTLPIMQEFNYDSSIVRDAVVRIMGEDRVFELEIDTSVSGYYFADKSYKIKANTEYRLECVLPNGETVTGKTITPAPSEWIKPPPPMIQFPIDTSNFATPDSLYIEWKKMPGYSFYALRINNLDSLEYGIYLDNVPDDELNRRVHGPPRGDRFFRETATWLLAPTSKTPVIWTIFKWFGPHEVSVMVPDYNFIEWFLQYSTGSQYNDLLGSIEGGKGVFGSASIIRDSTFLLKNQP
ncbi:MAG: DUF4249 family protein [Candidatus Kapaibacterium sp.]